MMADEIAWHMDEGPGGPRERFVPVLAKPIEDALNQAFALEARVGMEEIRCERDPTDETDEGELVIVAGGMQPMENGYYYYMRMRTPLSRVLAMREEGRLEQEAEEIVRGFVGGLEQEKARTGE